MNVLIAVNSNTSAAVFGSRPLVTFSHVTRAIPDGIELRSRFWIGWIIVDKEPVRVGEGLPTNVLEELAHRLAYHCPKEYYNLAAILPDVYAENSGIRDNIEDFR